MEDFIQVLIILILIISFLSPLFKKKGKQPSGPMPQRKPGPRNPETQEPSAKTEEGESDIFREIADLFKTEFPETPQKAKRQTTIEQRTAAENIPARSESQDYMGAEDVSYEKDQSLTEHSPTVSEHTIDQSFHRPTDWSKRKKPKIDSSVERRAESFKKLLEKKRPETNIYNLKIRDTLKNPQSLKEYILISEIIGRPKALKK